MTKHGPMIEELQLALADVTAQSMALVSRRIRVTDHPPGAAPVDVTTQCADALRRASDALNKAVKALENVDTQTASGGHQSKGPEA